MTPDPYASRVGDRWELAPRRDPVRWPGEDGPLDAEAVRAFERDGFLFLPGVLDPDETGRALAEVRRLTTLPGADVVREPDSEVVRSVFAVHRRSERLDALCRDERLAGVARQLVGSDVYVHQSRVNFKPPLDGREFAWHSDFETWHVEDGMPRMRAVSVSIALTRCTPWSGPLMVIPGSHRTFVRCAGETPPENYRTSLRRQQLGVPDVASLRALVEAGGIAAPTGGPGSVLFFDCNTLHASSGNLSPWPRTSLFFVYNSVHNALVEPFGGLPPRPGYLAERRPDAIG